MALHSRSRNAASTMTDLVSGAPLPYLLARPTAAGAPADGWPVLCFLHGYDEGPPTGIRHALTRHGPLRSGSSRLAGRFLVVAPQLPIRGDVWRRHAADVAEIVRDVQALHAGDPGRTCLTGFSFGGNGVFDVALARPGLWAALWAVDPTRVPVADPGVPVWLSAGALSRSRERDFVRRLRLERPVGDAARDRLITDAGLDHVHTASDAYADDAIYEWLLTRRRPPALPASATPPPL